MFSVSQSTWANLWVWRTFLNSLHITHNCLFPYLEYLHQYYEQGWKDNTCTPTYRSFLFFLSLCFTHTHMRERERKICEVQFSHSVVSDSLRPHEPQHARPPCPAPTPRVYPNPCPLSRWCYPTISSSAVPFSSCPQSFSASGSFPMSQLFASGGQNIRVSASTSVLPMNTQDWSPLG